MPTNDERREIAAELRENRDPLTPYNLVDYIFDDPWNHNSGEEVAARLADLIEPQERTCHIECVKSGPFYDVFRFDCCGKEYSESRTDDGATELPLAVCPFCGARVVCE